MFNTLGYLVDSSNEEDDVKADVKDAVDFSDDLLAAVPFGRSKALRTLGVVLFGAVATAVDQRRATAAPDSAPVPCSGFNQCPHCSYCACTCSNCRSLTTTCKEGDGHCWITCYNRRLSKCCDYYCPNFGNCICACDAGPC